MAGLTGCLAAWMAALRCHGSGSKRKWHILGEILWSYLGYCDSVVVDLPLPQPQYLYLLLLLLLVVFPRAAEWPTHTYTPHTAQADPNKHFRPSDNSRASSSELVRHFYCRTLPAPLYCPSLSHSHIPSLSL